MEIYSVKKGTILQHLFRYVQTGNPIRRENNHQLSKLGESDRKRMLAAFDRLGTDRLGPIFEALNGEIAYDELHLWRLHVIGWKKRGGESNG